MFMFALAMLLGCRDKSAPPDDTGPGEETGETGETAETGVQPVDADGDGHASLETGGDDCDDSNAEIFPGVEEICDEVDQDCDGEVDEDASDATLWYADADVDGYGDPAVSVLACERPEGMTDDATDCDDGASGAHPNAEEICGDGLDNGCDGVDDECRETGEVALAGLLGWTGDAGGDSLGYSVLGAGDLDGDGAADLALGAPGADGGGSRAGLARVLYGPITADGAARTADLDGDEEGAQAGTALAAVDLDGDGQVELAVGGAGAEDGAGATWIVAAPEEGSLSGALARVAGDGGSDESGSWLCSAGALDDAGESLLIGGAGASSGAGAVWVLPAGSAGALSLAEVDAVWTGGASSDALGPAAGGADLDGDGIPDGLLGAPGQDGAGSASGAAYVLLSLAEGGAVADADATWTGEAAGDAAGTAVVLLGDTDGDGYVDLAVGVPNHDEAGDYAGAAMLLRGPATAGGTLASADARILGGAAGDSAGSALGSPGDVDGDGLAELLVGSPWAEGSASNAGRAALLYGPLSGTISLDDAGVDLYGEASLNRAGSAVAGAGDVDDDGSHDLLVGAPYFRGTGSDSGKAYLWFGEGI